MQNSHKGGILKGCKLYGTNLLDLIVIPGFNMNNIMVIPKIQFCMQQLGFKCGTSFKEIINISLIHLNKVKDSRICYKTIFSTIFSSTTAKYPKQGFCKQ